MSRNTRVQFAINNLRDTGHDSVTKPRTRRGCITCRTRKVKCDEQRGICKTCARLGLECHWASPSVHNGQRSRTNRACQRCRQRKMRCYRPRTGESCGPCQQTGAACLPTIPSRDAPSSHSRSEQIPANAPNSTLGINSLPSRTEMMRLLDAYFNGPHNFCFFTFIHRPTFMQLLDNDLIPRCLLLIVLATIKRIEDPQGKLADSWADESCQLVLQGILAKISTSYLQALLLLQRYEQHRGAHLKAWFLSGLAIRLAHALQLNIDPLDTQPGSRKRTLPNTVVEVRRRLMWSCLVMESMMESGARPLSSLRISSIDIRLPCDETDFHLGRETETERVNFAKEFTFVSDISTRQPFHGISACAVKVAILRMQTIEYVFSYHPRNQANLPSELPWNPEAQFYGLRRKLDQMTDEVSKFDQNSLYGRSSGDIIKLLNLHCLFQGAYCDLLRIGALLTSLTARVEDSIFPKPPTWFLDMCGQGLLNHALRMAQVVSMSLRHLASDCDPFTAVCGCLAGRLLVIDRRPEDNDYLSLLDPTIRAAVDGAVQCARRVARWSEPVRKYLWAISKLSRDYAYKIDATDTSLHEPSPSTSSRPASREVSPSLRTYGTFGAIQRNLAINPDEAETDVTATAEQTENNQLFVPSEEPENRASEIEAPGLVEGDNNLPNNDYLLQQYSPLDQDALRIAAGWADGTFDLPSTEGLFDSTGVNFAPDFGLNETLFSVFGEG